MSTTASSLADYKMKRLGRKDYAFYLIGSWGGNLLVARYKCSWTEAKRRFVVFLATRRMLS